MNNKKDLIIKISSLSIFFLLIIMIGVLITKVNNLNKQLNKLHNEVSSLKGSVNSINSNIQNEIDDLIDELEQQAKNYFNVSTTIVDYNDNQILTVELKFSLKEYQKDSVVKIICENTKTFEVSSFLATNEIGNNFKAQLLLKYTDTSRENYLISYQIETNDLIKSEPLITFKPYSILYDRFKCDVNVRIDYSRENDDSYNVYIFIYNHYFGSNKLKIVSAELIIGDEVFDLTILLQDDGTTESYYNDGFVLTKSSENKNEEVIVRLAIVDQLGFTYYF